MTVISKDLDMQLLVREMREELQLPVCSMAVCNKAGASGARAMFPLNEPLKHEIRNTRQ